MIGRSCRASSFDFNNVEQIPGAEEFDLRFGLLGLHKVRRKVEWVAPVRVLPWDLFNSLPHPFWQPGEHKVSVIYGPGPPSHLTAVRS